MSASMYAPDYLRGQSDKNLHNIADMIEEQMSQLTTTEAENKKLKDLLERAKPWVEKKLMELQFASYNIPLQGEIDQWLKEFETIGG